MQRVMTHVRGPPARAYGFCSTVTELPLQIAHTIIQHIYQGSLLLSLLPCLARRLLRTAIDRRHTRALQEGRQGGHVSGCGWLCAAILRQGLHLSPLHPICSMHGGVSGQLAAGIRTCNANHVRHMHTPICRLYLQQARQGRGRRCRGLHCRSRQAQRRVRRSPLRRQLQAPSYPPGTALASLLHHGKGDGSVTEALTL